MKNLTRVAELMMADLGEAATSTDTEDVLGDLSEIFADSILLSVEEQLSLISSEQLETLVIGGEEEWENILPITPESDKIFEVLDELFTLIGA